MQKDSSTRLCNYHYDPLDRLSRSQSSDQTSIGRFYNQSRLATEIQGLNRHSIFQHGDQLLAQRSHDGKAIDTTLLATDTQRSVLTEVSSKTHRTAAYTAYGHTDPGNGLLSLLGFNGERSDPVTGHYLLGNGYRAFNPVLMRFNSPDSWSPFGKGGINAYAYCTNPITYSDPTGHIKFKTLSTVIARSRSSLKKAQENSLRKLTREGIPEVELETQIEFVNDYMRARKSSNPFIEVLSYPEISTLNKNPKTLIGITLDTFTGSELHRLETTVYKNVMSHIASRTTDSQSLHRLNKNYHPAMQIANFIAEDTPGVSPSEFSTFLINLSNHIPTNMNAADSLGVETYYKMLAIKLKQTRGSH